MLLVLNACGWAFDLDVANVESTGDVPCQTVVTEHCDPAVDRVMVSGQLAFSLGVNKYMGKPYQEDLLLNNINELLGKPAS